MTHERYQILRKKIDNTSIINDTKIYKKMKNKSWLNIVEKYNQMRNATL